VKGQTKMLHHFLAVPMILKTYQQKMLVPVEDYNNTKTCTFKVIFVWKRLLPKKRANETN
jgi:hypothetical protein